MHSLAMLTASLHCDWMNLSKDSAGKKLNLSSIQECRIGAANGDWW